jgi:hypothetical protein
MKNRRQQRGDDQHDDECDSDAVSPSRAPGQPAWVADDQGHEQDGFDRREDPGEMCHSLVRLPDPRGDVERQEHDQRCGRRPA